MPGATQQGILLVAYSFIVGLFLAVSCVLLKLITILLFPGKENNPAKNLTLLPGTPKEVNRVLFPSERKFSARDFTLVIADLIFAVFAALTVIIMLYHLNFGEIRLFSLLSALGGFLAGHFLLCRFFLKPLRKLICFVFSEIYRIIRILLKPIIGIFRLTLKPVISQISKKTKRKRTSKVLNAMIASELSRSRKRKYSQNENSGRINNNRNSKKTAHKRKHIPAERHGVRNKTSV